MPEPGSRAEEDLALARVAMERGLVTRDEVRTCLQIQSDFAAIGSSVPLGQLLIRRRLIDVETFVDLAREVRARAVRCPGCRVLSLLPTGGRLPDGASQGRCASCGGVLPLGHTQTDGGAVPPAQPGGIGAGTAASAAPATDAAAGVAAGEASATGRMAGAGAPTPDRNATALPAVGAPEAGRGAKATAAVPAPAGTGVAQSGASAGAETRKKRKRKGRGKGKRSRRRRHESLTGRRFGSNEVLDEIARGGMGVVYRARDHERMKIVALKVLKDGVHATEKQVRRFQREVATVQKLKHPNIVGIYSVGTTEEQHWFSMELVEGHPLDEVLRRGPMPVRRSFEVIEQVARGIHHAHEHGVIHRDLKPANVLLDRRAVPMITDFGLAKNVDHTSAMTKTGAAVGTPFYMPPEQAKGDARRIDRRVDVYALGVLLFEMTTGELPFDGDTNIEVYRKIMEDDAPSPSSIDPRIDADADRVILKAMAKERDDRYLTSLALADDLRRWLDGHPVEARPPSTMRRMARRARRSAPMLAAVLGVVLFVLAVVVSVLVIDERSARRERASEARTELAARTRTAESLESDLGASLRRAEALLANRRADEVLALAEEALAGLRAVEKWPSELRFPDINGAPVAALLADTDARRRELTRDLLIVRGGALGLRGTAEADAQAQVSFEEAERTDPGAAVVHLARGRLFLARGRLAEAVGAFSAALGRDAASTDALLARGEAQERLGRFDGAIQDYRQVVRIERDGSREVGPARYRPIGSEVPTKLAGALVRVARCDLRLERPAEARRHLDEIIDSDPGHFPAYVLRAEARLASADVMGALDDARASVEIKRGRPEGHVALGRVELVRGRAEQAAAAFRDALACDRSHAPAALFLGLASEQLGEQRAALDGFAQAAEGRLDDAFTAARAVAWLRRGEVKRTLGEADAASIAYEQASALLPRLLAVELGRARLALAEGRTEQARAAVERGLGLHRRAEGLEPADADGSETVALQAIAGWTALAEGDAARAAEAFRRALGAAGDGIAFEAATGLGQALLRLGDESAAGEAFRTALSEERRIVGDEPLVVLLGGAAEVARVMASAELGACRPDVTGALLMRRAAAMLARAAEEVGGQAGADARQALALLDQASGYAPTLATGHLRAAETLASLGDRAAATAAAQRAAAANPFLTEAHVLVGRLRFEQALAQRGEDDARRQLLDGALSALDRAAASGPEQASAWFWRGKVRLAQRDDDGAVADLHRALGAATASGAASRDSDLRRLQREAHALLAETHARHGRDAAARAERERARQLLEADRARALDELREGLRGLEEEDLPRAFQHFDRAIALDGTLAAAWYNRGVVSLKLLRVREAALDLIHSVELRPGYLDQAFLEIERGGLALDLEPLRREVQQLAEREPENVSAHALLAFYPVVRGYLLQEDVRPDAAVALRRMERVLELSPRFAAAYAGRAYLYLALERTDEAVEDVEEAKRLSGGGFVALSWVEALAHAARGDVEATVRALSDARDRGLTDVGRIRGEPAFARFEGQERFRAFLQTLESGQ
jgi:tetratricopeptide (TPR) repeat protein